MQVKKQQLDLDMEQWTVSKLGKDYVKAEYCHLLCLTSMKSTSGEMPSWMTHKQGINIAGRNINNLRYAVDTTLKTETTQEWKSLLMKVKEESENFA